MTTIQAIADVLMQHGDRFTGNGVREEAEGWRSEGFNAETANAWCEIGVWDAETAAKLRDAGVTPAQVSTAAKTLIEDSIDPENDYTDGDPIYACCNGDLDVETLIDAAKKAA